VNFEKGPLGSAVIKVDAPITTRGAVSPTAREIARIVPVRIPGRALGSTWFQTVCQRVPPSPKLANRREFGTALIASCALMIINGRIRTPRVSPAERIVRPLSVDPSPPIPKTVPLVIGSSRRTKIARPKIP
jgi:hypothetical protein